VLLYQRRRLRCEREILCGDPDAPAPPGGAPRDLHCIAVSPDGGRIAVGAADGRLMLRAATGTDTTVVVAGAHDEINDVAFSPDGRLVATAGQDGRVCLWESETGALYREVAAESKPLFAVCWSPDGTRLAWGGEERILSVGDPDGGAARRIAVPLVLDEGGSGGDIEAALFADQASIVVAGGHQILILELECNITRYEPIGANITPAALKTLRGQWKIRERGRKGHDTAVGLRF
jgi:WD40 repeat protein